MTETAGSTSAQSRLEVLLRATQALGSDLSLAVVLQRLVDSARELVDARYAALGTLDPDGGLAQLVTAGMSDEQESGIAQFPVGLGLLSACIEHPVRVSDINQHPERHGFPAGHPPMSTFLGVPVRVRNSTFGMLYLTERRDGAPFSDEDEQLAAALAAAAGSAIQNARLYEQARSRERSLQVSVEITRNLLLQTTDPLELIAHRALEATGADSVVVTVPIASGFRAAAAVGHAAAELRGLTFGDAGSLTGHALRGGKPLRMERLEDISTMSNPHGFGSTMVVPIVEQGSGRGALLFSRLADRPSFVEADLTAGASFGDHLALALYLSDAEGDRERLTLLEDRTRIARDLHDNVIQRLFATGLGLQQLADRMTGTDADRMGQHITALDDTIRQIRQTIFALRSAEAAQPLRTRLLEVADQAAGPLGFAPLIVVPTELDRIIGPELADDIVACAREGLSNIVRHAHASYARVTLAVAHDRPEPELVLDIVDNGVGLSENSRRSGLANMNTRAQRAGGTVTLLPASGGGLHLSWRVGLPLSAAS